MEITQADIPGLEGDQLQVTVRLEGQIFGDVSVELHLLTLPQFLDRPEAPQGYTLSEDPAECKVARFLIRFQSRVFLSCVADDFSHDDDLQHTFHAVSVVRQTVDFNIDIVDDSTNEKKEQFIVLVDEPTIANQEEDFYEPDDSDRLFAVVTINIDPDYPDSQSLSLCLSFFFLPLSIVPFPSVCVALSLFRLSLPNYLFIHHHFSFSFSPLQRPNCGSVHHLGAHRQYQRVSLAGFSR